MQIYVKTPRNTISLHVDLTYSISKLKKILCDREGIPITEQRLIYAGKQLEDTKTVAYYAIQRESTLYLMTRLRGGAGELTITFYGDFSLTLSSAGLLTARVGGSYSNGTPAKYNFILKNRLDDTTTEAVPGVDGSYENDYFGAGTFRITFTVTITNIAFVTYYRQLIRYVFYIETVTGGLTETTTSEITKYLFIPNSSSNILMTENKIKSITRVDITSENKSVMLPPITTTVTRGTILHFKITARSSPYTFQIMPYFSATVPTVYTFYDTLPLFDSTIDTNTVGPPIVYLDAVNRVVSLISDGVDDWRILNYYDGSLSISIVTSLPNDRVQIISQKVVLYYTDPITNICIFPFTESYYTVRYLTISNGSSFTVTYTIYFPVYVNLENQVNSNQGCYTIQVTLLQNTIQSIMFMSTPTGYLILGKTTYSPGITVDNSTRNETPYTLLSKNITCPSLLVAGELDCEIPAATTLTTGTSKLCIIKSRRNSNTALKTNIYTPHGDTSSKIIYNGNNNSKISISQENSGALWLSVYYTTFTNILPIHYYSGAAGASPSFVSYPTISGGGGGGPGGFG